MKSKRIRKVSLILAAVLLLSAAVGGLAINADFRDTVALAVSSKDAALVTLDTTVDAAKAAAPSLKIHFGDWVAGDKFTAEFTYVYTGNITAFQAPQLDLIDSDGTNRNSCFEGTVKVESTSAGTGTETVSWADEQKFQFETSDTNAVIKVTYDLEVKTALPSGKYLVPEFKCAAVQQKHKASGYQASYRAVTGAADTAETGFYAALGAADIYDAEHAGVKFGTTYGGTAFTKKTLKFTVTPDNNDTETTVNVWKLSAPTAYADSAARTVLSSETVSAVKNAAYDFYAVKGMDTTVIADASNAKAGHRIYAYRITWPEAGSLGVSKVELDLAGNVIE